MRVRHAEGEAPLVRRYAEISYGAKSWKCQRRVSARIEAGCNGLDIRYVVTNIRRGSAEWLYDTLYCERGQAENLIKLHKSQLASDRTSCRSPLANQVRLLLHTVAYWLLLAVRDANPKQQPLARAEFTTLRLRLTRWRPASSRPPRGCASPSPPRIRRPSYSRASRAGSSPPGHDARGDVPRTRPVPPTSSAQQICSEDATKGRIGEARPPPRRPQSLPSYE